MIRGISIVVLSGLLMFAASNEALAQEEPARTAVTGVKTFRTTMAGGEEGSTGRSGNAFVVVSPNSGRVCWGYDVEGVSPPTAAHIHEGAAGESGSPVVTLDLDGTCTLDVDRDIIVRIASNPADFYVNIHNDDFPDGALRGQLGD